MTKDNERFIEIDFDEIYYIVDTLGLKLKKDSFEIEEDYEEYLLQNSLNGEEVVKLLNEFDKRLFEKNSRMNILKCKIKEQQSELEIIDKKYQYLLNKNEKTIQEQEERINELEYSVNLLSNHKDILVDIVSRDPIAKEYLRQLGVITN